MMPKVRTLLALSILFLLPIISYFIMSKAAKITISAVEELDMNEPIEEVVEGEISESMKNHTGVICYDCQTDISFENLQTLVSDYNHEERLNFFIIGGSCPEIQTEYTYCFSDNSIKKQDLKGKILVVDNQGHIRRAVRPTTKEDWIDLSQSIALLMPRKTKPSVQYKKPG